MKPIKFKHPDLNNYKTALPLNAGGYMFTTATGERAQKLKETYDLHNVSGKNAPRGFKPERIDGVWYWVKKA